MATAAAATEMWNEVDEDDLSASWFRRLRELLARITGAQREAARDADTYVDAVLRAQGVTPARADTGAPAQGDRQPGSVRPEALSGIASDGRPLETLLENPVVATKIAIASGHDTDVAMATGRATLEMAVRTQVADAGRVADSVAITTRERVGYVRMLVPPGDCARCIILAGRFYRYSEGFLRHPNCNCIHVPSVEDVNDDLATDPKAYFQSLSEAEQDRIFTKAGARAIRDGADMNQVVNARRGAAGLTAAGARLTRDEQRMQRGGGDRGELQRTDVFGQQVFTTTEGTTTRGLAGQRMREQGARTTRESGETVTRRARGGEVQRTVNRRRVQTPRLMPESIYELADSREEAIRLLRRFGYII